MANKLIDRSRAVLARLGIDTPSASCVVGCQWMAGDGDAFSSRSPVDGRILSERLLVSRQQVLSAVDMSADAFRQLRVVPAPRRGQFVRRIGELLREHQQDLAALVTLEAGKITSESLGEVQEMIDIAEFAVGLSRQLYGLTIASERPAHRLTETWHPLGPVGVISAFNFPVAVWAWNAMIAWVCGDPVIWKPSEQTPLCALGCQAIVGMALSEFDDIPDAISSVVIGDAEAGHELANSQKLPLVSATGSVPMGRAVAETVARRLGRTLLELGGNNGMIVTASADLELAVRAIVFSAVGTCGQRCTSLRRLIVHDSVYDELLDRIQSAYSSLPIGNPFDEQTLIGPLVSERSFAAMQSALAEATSAGGTVFGGRRFENGVPAEGFYVNPAIVEIDSTAGIVREETFAPILYIMRYSTWEEAIEIHNSVPQGLASAVFTNDVREAELFCSAAGSDCGIVNVNVGPSGAEIGGAFGGEKDTGGGRESGSDSWKTYMRRTTSTVNYSTALPLSQGITFDI